jgi:hypothetical protein
MAWFAHTLGRIKGVTMKKLALVSTLLISGLALAQTETAPQAATTQDVDYSRCNMYGGSGFFSIGNDGQLVPTPGTGYTLKSKRTEGGIEHYEYELPRNHQSPYGNMFRLPSSQKVTLHRDQQGRVVRMVTGGDAVHANDIRAHRDMLATINSNMASLGQGTMEPVFFVDNKLVPLSQLTNEQARAMGHENLDEIKQMRRQWRRDSRTQQRLQQQTRRLIDRAPLVMPLGSSTSFEITDNVCTPVASTQRHFNTANREVIETPNQILSRSQCAEVARIYEANGSRLRECQALESRVNSELFDARTAEASRPGNASGAGGGIVGVVGGVMSGNVVVSGGMAGGMVGGYPGGYYHGGIVSGAMGGWGYPGSMGMVIGVDSIQMVKWSCDHLYGSRPTEGTNNGNTAGSGSGVTFR